MRKIVVLLLWILVPLGLMADGAHLKVELARLASGVKLHAIKSDGRELLAKEANPTLFRIDLKKLSDGKIFKLFSSKGWHGIKVKRRDEVTQEIRLSQPTDETLPRTLQIIITMQVRVGEVDWDLRVEGIGSDFSVLESRFPLIDLKPMRDARLFVPYRFGKVIRDPLHDLDYGDNKPNDHFLNAGAGLYPMGWGATMPYMAYYGSDLGLFLCACDKKASIKTLIAKGRGDFLHIATKVPAPNMGRGGNDFAYPGLFQMRIYHGDWYEAARLYRSWVRANADYYPRNDSARTVRLKRLKSVDVWATQPLWNGHGNYSAKVIAKMMRDLKKRLGTEVVLGAYWLSPHDRANEDDFPQFYPSKTVLTLNKNLKKAFGDKISLSLYTNGYLYDTKIAHPDRFVPPFSKVRRFSAKKADGSPYTQKWIGNRFAVMCATQKPWQDILVNVHRRFVSHSGVDGVLLDQITSTSPKLCMDTTHGHPIGGGHYWREGYKTLLSRLHRVYPEGRYFVSEGFNDSLMDQIEGYETIHYMTQDQVPAVQVVYGDRASFIGPRSGTNTYKNQTIPDDEALYGKTGEAFIFGSTIGYFYPDLGHSPLPGSQRANAVAYVRKLAQMHHRLVRFIAYGQMQKPLYIAQKERITVPADRSHWIPQVTMKAIQNSVWRDRLGNIACIFLNVQTPDSHKKISFDIDFNGKRYGLNGALRLKAVTSDGERELGKVANHFQRRITLDPADVVAIVVSEG